MNAQLTRRQHQVPQCYLKLWGNTTNKLWLYDLKTNRKSQKGTKNILFGEFYYEEDPETPDNRIENILGTIETECAPILKKLNVITENHNNYSQNQTLKKALESYLSSHHQKIIKKFAAFQYLRIPGAVEQKEYELQGSFLPKLQIDYGLNPGRFVESGFEYLKEQFMSLVMIISYSFEDHFLTSDWPCFDMKDSEDAPLLGEEIGRSNEVVACLPLGPRISALFVPKNINNNFRLSTVPKLIIRNASGSQVKNQNKLVIQQCTQYVIYNKDENFIFSVAKKRKKAKL